MGGEVPFDFSKDGRGVDVAGYDAVIMVMAEAPYAEMKGDILYPNTMRHSARYPQQLEILQRVSGKGTPVVSILFSGRPVYANDLINLSDAFVAAWLPGTEGRGVTDVLFQRGAGNSAARFNGRLPFAWPGNPCPESKEARNLFERGYGLDMNDRPSSKNLPVDNRLTCPALAE